MKIIENIFKYQLRDNYIIYYHENDKMYLKCDFNANLLSITEVKECHWFFEDIRYLQIGENGIIGYYSDTKIEKQLLNYYRPIINNIGVAHVFNNSDSRLHLETLFRLPEEKQIIEEWLPNSIYPIQDQYWCNDTIEDLKLIDAEKGEILWVIPQPEVEKPYGYNGLTNTKKVLGIYNNNLWIQLPDSRILGLDIASGKINHEIKNEEYFSIDSEGISFDKKNGIIHILGFDIYVLFNIDKLSFIKEFILPDTIRITKSCLINTNQLSFVARINKSSEPNAYGIFDTNTQTINFLKEKEPEMGYFYQAPQVNNDLFAILDEKGNLILHKIKEML